MKTKSEELTSIISKKFFLHQYIYNDVYVDVGNQEYEFCDCLMEFGNVYVCIQIKERDMSATGSSEKWFKNKVLGIAKKQTKDTFKYFNDCSNTIFSKTSDLFIDRSKTLIPIIVFLNTNISDYERIVYSKSLNSIINIFNYSDFKTMLENLVLPYDILNYLSYRVMFGKTRHDKIVFDEFDDDATMLFVPQNEEDYAQMFLLRTYYKDIIEHNLKEEYVQFYNSIVNQLNIQNQHARSGFIEGLVQMDYMAANNIAQNWAQQVDCVKKGKYNIPYKFSVGKKLYMFFTHPDTMSDEDFHIRLNLCLVYLRYKYDFERAYIIKFCDEEEDNYSVELYDINMLTEIPYDSILEQAINFFEKD